MESDCLWACMILVGLTGRGKWPFGALVLAERALCGDEGCIGFIGGDGAVATVFGEWLPWREESPPIKDEMDMVAPGLELNGGRSLEPT